LLFLGADTTILEAETRLAGLLDDSIELLPLRIGEGVDRTLL
jgi:hypothetical protein